MLGESVFEAIMRPPSLCTCQEYELAENSYRGYDIGGSEPESRVVAHSSTRETDVAPQHELHCIDLIEFRQST